VFLIIVIFIGQITIFCHDYDQHSAVRLLPWFRQRSNAMPPGVVIASKGYSAG
jgi:hypothetical protein